MKDDLPYVVVGKPTYKLTDGQKSLADRNLYKLSETTRVSWRVREFKGYKVLWNSCVSPPFKGDWAGFYKSLEDFHDS